MLAFERKSRVIQYLEQNGKAGVTELATLLNVVPETIRRDLRELEKQGVLTRTHGGALLKNKKEADFPYEIRAMKNSLEKDRICRRAARFIEDGDLIFIDSSSTLLHLLKYIDRNSRLTILTNSLEIIHTYANHSNENITMICTGGVFNKYNMSLSGAIASQYAANFFPNKAFVSCHGISPEYGFTDGNLHELGFKRDIINKTGKAFFLVDHTKFGKLGPIHLGDFNICDVIITDQAPPEDFRLQMMQSNPNLELIIAKQEAAGETSPECTCL